MKKFSDLQVNDYIYYICECCDVTIVYRITSIDKGSIQTTLLMKEFGNDGGTRQLNIPNNELDQLIKDLPFKKTPEETMTPEEYYENFKGKFVSYDGKMDGKVAGYFEDYLIIGFDDECGCIKSFSPQVVYDKDYKSYRFSKMKNITPF